jgi:hypothetical protein
MTAAKAKSLVLKKDFDLKVTLHAPGSYPSHRVTYYEPTTGKRETRAAGTHIEAAEQKFDEICEYVRATRALAFPRPAPGRSTRSWTSGSNAPRRTVVRTATSTAEPGPTTSGSTT